MNNIIFQNYHYHTYESNPSSPDSVASPRDYAKRAKELGHGIVSSLEHGFQGEYHKLYNLAQEEGLKFIFGTEAYWVKDRLAVDPETNRRDNTNSHLCLFAKNENGRRMINYILSIANEDGYYYSPRIDLELLHLLNPDDVFITTACVAYWKYEDIEDITLQLHKHFGDSMMLEVQAHNTPKQIAINKRIKQLAIDNNDCWM